MELSHLAEGTGDFLQRLGNIGADDGNRIRDLHITGEPLCL